MRRWKGQHITFAGVQRFPFEMLRLSFKVSLMRRALRVVSEDSLCLNEAVWFSTAAPGSLVNRATHRTCSQTKWTWMSRYYIVLPLGLRACVVLQRHIDDPGSVCLQNRLFDASSAGEHKSTHLPTIYPHVISSPHIQYRNFLFPFLTSSTLTVNQ